MLDNNWGIDVGIIRTTAQHVFETYWQAKA